jgi:hypothetical protein
MFRDLLITTQRAKLSSSVIRNMVTPPTFKSTFARHYKYDGPCLLFILSSWLFAAHAASFYRSSSGNWGAKKPGKASGVGWEEIQ